MGKRKLIDQLSESRLLRYVMLHVQNVLQPKVETRLTDGTSPKLATKYEYYVMEVFQSLTRIINTVESLEYILLFLKRLPPKDFFRRHEFTKAKYFQYQIENHLIRVSTIYDQMILLANAAFQLGIQEKKCNEDLIVNNKHTKGTDSIKCLKECKKGIVGVITARNLIVHRGEFDDSDLEKLDTYTFIARFTDLENTENRAEAFLSKGFVEQLSKSVQQNKIQLIEKNNIAVVKILLKYFRSLETPIGDTIIALHPDKIKT